MKQREITTISIPRTTKKFLYELLAKEDKKGWKYLLENMAYLYKIIKESKGTIVILEDKIVLISKDVKKEYTDKELLQSFTKLLSYIK